MITIMIIDYDVVDGIDDDDSNDNADDDEDDENLSMSRVQLDGYCSDLHQGSGRSRHV